MSQEPVNAESSIEEQLVAYLDGELDGESCRRIEELLAVDAEVRRKLHWLERTWEILDELDTAPVGEDFTRTTMEMVALAAEEDVGKIAKEAPRRRRRAWLLTGLGMIVAGVAGYVVFALAAPNANRQLVKDLPVLENLDEYEQIQDINFLRMLLESGLFPRPESKEGEGVSSPPGADRGLQAGAPDAAERVKNLTPAQKAELVQKRKTFAGLGLDGQNQLRQLHEQIQTDPREELWGVMERYYEWFKLLPSYYRLELSHLSDKGRIEWIKNYKEKEKTEISNRPPAGKDSDVLWRWMEDYAAGHEKEFMDKLPEQMRKELSGRPPSAVRRWIIGMIWLRQQGGGNRGTQFSEADLSQLRSMFTAETQKLLEAKSKKEQVAILQNWARYLLRQRSPRRGPGAESPVSDEQLAEFFDKDLTPEERDRLMNLSGEDMQQQLLWDYIMKNRQPGMFPRRPDEFGPGPMPGQGPGPDRRQLDRPEKPESQGKKP